MLILAFFFLLFFFVVLATVIFIPFGVQWIENRFLLNPTIVQEYENAPGTFVTLKSGGGLLHYGTGRGKEGGRKVLFLHGNAGCLDDYARALEILYRRGYDVYALEYAGFMPRAAKPPEGMSQEQWTAFCACKPNPSVLLQNVFEAWQLMPGDSDSIIMGYSLGGGALGQVYDQLRPLPGMLVFLNTFYSLPQLAAEQVTFLPPEITDTMLIPFISTRWACPEPQCYRGKVVIVYARDDALICSKHAQQLAHVFAPLKPEVVCLSSGGHVLSIILYHELWADKLLPPLV